MSTNKQENSIQDQEKAIIEWWERSRSLPEFSDHKWGKFFKDPATSGATSLFKRKGGQQLAHNMKSGDIVLVTKLDRAFRSLTDMIDSVENLTGLGVEIVFVHDTFLNNGSNSAAGKLILRIMAAIAEFERDLLSERIKEGIKRSPKKHRRDFNRRLPVGWRLSKSRYKRYPTEDEYTITLAKNIAEYLVQENLSKKQVTQRELMDAGLVLKNGKAPKPDQLRILLASACVGFPRTLYGGGYVLADVQKLWGDWRMPFWVSHTKRVMMSDVCLIDPRTGEEVEKDSRYYIAGHSGDWRNPNLSAWDSDEMIRLRNWQEEHDNELREAGSVFA